MERMDWQDAFEKAFEPLRRAPKGGVRHAREERQYKGGQFIDRATWEREQQVATQALPSALREFDQNLQFLRRVYEQQVRLFAEGKTGVELVPLSTVEDRMKTQIRQAYARVFLLGKRAAGNLTSATEVEQDAVMRLRRDEYRYLRGFLADIREGRGKMAYDRRMEMYGAAARELYWLGWVMGDTRTGRMIEWHVAAEKEHCSDCLRYSEHGPYDVAAFLREVVGMGHLPQSGALECLGFQCGCWLGDRRLPGVEPPALVSEPKAEPAKPPAPPKKGKWRQTRMRFTLPKTRDEVLEADFTEPRFDLQALPPKPSPKPGKPAEPEAGANVRFVLPLGSAAKSTISVLGLRPEVWLRLDRAKVKTVGQLARYTQGDLAALGVSAADVATIRRAVAAFVNASGGEKGNKR